MFITKNTIFEPKSYPLTNHKICIFALHYILNPNSEMKKLLFILPMFFCVFTFAQKLKEADVKPGVIQAFGKKFPDASKVKWEKEGADYEGNFTQNGVEKSVVIDTTGKILEIESEIALKDVPQTVKDYLAKTYADYKIKELSKLELTNQIQYEVEVKKGKELWELRFNTEGKFLRKMEVNKEKD